MGIFLLTFCSHSFVASSQTEYPASRAISFTYGIEIGMKQGMEKGMEKKGRTVIMNLLKLNMPIDNIAAATESPIPYVKEIAREAGYSV